MAKMRAVQISKPGGAFELVERDVPEAAPTQVRIKVEACGICHSDLLVKSGAYPGLQLPRIPGHEIAGRLDAVGAQVSAWKVGDRVGVGWHGGHCFVCVPCRKGLFINCEKALARELGAHEDVDTQKVPAAQGLQKLGGADLVLATAPNNEAIAETLDGLKPRGKLLIVAAPFEPLRISAFSLLTGKTIAGWPSGSSATAPRRRCGPIEAR